jgi:hypothetical protein
MPAKKSSQTAPCPHCLGVGVNPTTGGRCSNCGGAGHVDNFFPFPYHYPINLTVVTPGLPALFSAPTLTVPGSPGNPYQQGTNPAILKLGSDNPFGWVFTMLKVSSPTIVGDASDWLQLYLEDLSGTNWPFQAAPIVASLYGGDAKNPFPELDPLTFGEQTQLRLTGYPILIEGNTISLRTGTGAPATYTGQLNGPVLPGSVVLELATVASATDDGEGNIAGTGITGVVNYTTGAVSVTLTTAALMAVTWTQGPAVLNCQFDLQGPYKRQLTAAEQAQNG